VANRYQNGIELSQGTRDLLILQTLQSEPRHGCAISPPIRANSGDILQVDLGSLAADSKMSENKQRARDRLTKRVRRQLLSERSRWGQISDAMAGVLNPARRESGS